MNYWSSSIDVCELPKLYINIFGFKVLLFFFADSGEDEDDESMDDFSDMSMEMEPCIAINELRLGFILNLLKMVCIGQS